MPRGWDEVNCTGGESLGDRVGPDRTVRCRVCARDIVNTGLVGNLVPVHFRSFADICGECGLRSGTHYDRNGRFACPTVDQYSNPNPPSMPIARWWVPIPNVYPVYDPLVTEMERVQELALGMATNAEANAAARQAVADGIDWSVIAPPIPTFVRRPASRDRVRAYTYEAGTHCIRCAQTRFMPTEGVRREADDPLLDENGVPDNQYDDEGNLVHPVFQSELHELTHDPGEDGHSCYLSCDTCAGIISDHYHEDRRPYGCDCFDCDDGDPDDDDGGGGNCTCDNCIDAEGHLWQAEDMDVPEPERLPEVSLAYTDQFA